MVRFEMVNEPVVTVKNGVPLVPDAVYVKFTFPEVTILSTKVAMFIVAPAGIVNATLEYVVPNIYTLPNPAHATSA
jgi:hypothetical protein